MAKKGEFKQGSRSTTAYYENKITGEIKAVVKGSPEARRYSAYGWQSIDWKRAIRIAGERHRAKGLP
jgi:hypothetical protein